jgi:2-keto-3-deoxy-L-rhamnonate aldolase RhmA
MVRTNRTKAKIKEGDIAIGGGVNFYAPILVELYGVMGFDWVWIDCEHGSSNDSETENMVRAAELYDLTPVVRVPNALPSTLLRFLDRGAQGLIVPHISTRKEAEEVARASHYYPLGDRSSSTAGRTNRLGSGLPPAQYYEAANRETLVIVMIETPEAVENVREIASVPGIDAVLVGSSDLTQAMGMPGSDQVDAAIEKVITGAQAEGKAVGVAGAGMTVSNVARYQEFARRGVQLLSANVQEFIRQSGGQFLEAVRQR